MPLFLCQYFFTDISRTYRFNYKASNIIHIKEYRKKYRKKIMQLNCKYHDCHSGTIGGGRFTTFIVIYRSSDCPL